MRLKKILFVVLVLVLLSMAVAADDKPKVKVNNVDKRGAKIREVAAAKAKIGEIIARKEKPEDWETEGWKRELNEVVEAYGEYKEQKAQLAEIRTNIWARGGYSFYDIIDAYEDYIGINKYSALFFGEDWLAKRREMAAEYFCEKTLLLGGKQCWQSKICEHYYTSKEPPVGRSVLVAQTGIGGYEPAVSIQGERSLPITYKEGGKSKRRYVYKLTYFIANPHKRAMTYHIKLIGSGKEFTSPAMTIKRATEDEFFRVERLGNNPLISESDNYYHTVCLTFSPRMVAASGMLIGARRVSEICAPLISYEGAATRPYTLVPGAEEAGAAEAAEEGAPEYEENPLAGA